MFLEEICFQNKLGLLMEALITDLTPPSTSEASSRAGQTGSQVHCVATPSLQLFELVLTGLKCNISYAPIFF